jgi:hypothetical protein
MKHLGFNSTITCGGGVYNTTIQTTNGPVAIGAKAKASTEGLTVEDALRLLEKVQ